MSYQNSSEYTSNNGSYQTGDIPGRPPGCCLKGCCEFGKRYRGLE